MAASGLQLVLKQAESLPFNDQLQLIKLLLERLRQKHETQTPRYMIYGEFRNSPRPESTEEDFKLAEWHPTEEELNGE
jgi:hypothetical protein